MHFDSTGVLALSAATDLQRIANWARVSARYMPAPPGAGNLEVIAVIEMMNAADPTVCLLDEATPLNDRFAFYSAIVVELSELTDCYRAAFKSSRQDVGYGQIFCEILAFSIRVLIASNRMLAPTREKFAAPHIARLSPLADALNNLQNASESAIFNAADIVACNRPGFGRGHDRLVSELTMCVPYLGKVAQKQVAKILRSEESSCTADSEQFKSLMTWAGIQM